MKPILVSRRGGAITAVVAALLTVGFIVAFGARSAIVLSTAAVDDALFIRLGQNLASGRWLGGYNEFTLVKGPGFPAFLALGNVTGLPFPLALAIFHAACAGFSAVVAARVTGVRAAGLALFAALLLAPPLYEGEMTRVFRDMFYASLCVAFASALIALAGGLWDRRKLVLATGFLGAWAWLTREEGVWLAPLALVAFLPLLNSGRVPGLRAVAASLRTPGLALAVAVMLVVGFGLVNWAVYGRFVVNEIKDKAFQGAMTALQDAAAPYHKTGIPVPAEARARIYAVSPSFAALREPVLDGVAQAEETQAGCQENKAMCGDFGGGWFQWALRRSAALDGHHATAPGAAAFYRKLSGEVAAACDDGRLTCKHWPVPLAPPMTADEIDDVGRSFVGIVDTLTFGGPVLTQQRPSNLSAPGADRMLGFLNVPKVQDAGRVRAAGWFRGKGDAWFTLQPVAGTSVIAFARRPSPDLISAFNDPAAGAQRFTLEVECATPGTCPVTVAPDGAAPVQIDLATAPYGAHPVGEAILYLDDPGDPTAPILLKERLSQAWINVAARLGPLYRGLVVVGLIAYLAALVFALRRRRVDAATLVATALLGAVAARSVILALIDALAFRASSNAYALPGMLLLLMFSAYAAGAVIAARRRPAADA